MPCESEEAGCPLLAWMRRVRHVFRHGGKIAVENHVAVQLNLYFAAVDSDFLKVPRFGWALETPSGRNHAVGRTVILARIQFGVVRVF